MLGSDLTPKQFYILFIIAFIRVWWEYGDEWPHCYIPCFVFSSALIVLGLLPCWIMIRAHMAFHLTKWQVRMGFLFLLLMSDTLAYLAKEWEIITGVAYTYWFIPFLLYSHIGALLVWEVCGSPARWGHIVDNREPKVGDKIKVRLYVNRPVAYMLLMLPFYAQFAAYYFTYEGVTWRFSSLPGKTVVIENYWYPVRWTCGGKLPEDVYMEGAPFEIWTLHDHYMMATDGMQGMWEYFYYAFIVSGEIPLCTTAVLSFILQVHFRVFEKRVAGSDWNDEFWEYESEIIFTEEARKQVHLIK